MRTAVPAVIVMAERQRKEVERLVQHCVELDNTKLTVLEVPFGDRTPYPQCATNAFHQAAEHFKGKAFLWMEADAIPLKAGWRQAITDEYRRIGKPFLLPDMTGAHKMDVAAGIGVYPGEARWLLPREFKNGAWDLWLAQHMEPVIGRTKLLQHSYGDYSTGKSRPHRFPRDSRIIRPEAVIYHRDKFQDLITGGSPATKEVVFTHGGDLGDVLAALPILRERGGGKIILFHDPNAPVGQRGRESLAGARYESIKPLLEAQSYVSGVEWGEGVDTKNFRTVNRANNENLTERQARHAGVWPVNMSPWLTVPGEVVKHNRVVCARSLRYHNPTEFPWRELAETYGDRLLFIGLPGEHEAFEKVVARSVEHAITPDFLEIAKIMAGAPQVVANQSAPLWVALGLGCKIICEVCPAVPNSTIPRPGSFFAMTQGDMDVLRRSFAKVRERKIS